MNININTLQDKLCALMCANVRLSKKTDNLIRVETPFLFSDGDPYQIYIQERPNGILRLTDMGHTWMQLSYENDIDNFKDGTRGNLLGQIKTEIGLEEENGAFFIETSIENLGNSIFKLGQGLTKITDLAYLRRSRVESTFYEDLTVQLNHILPNHRIYPDYVNPRLNNPEIYPIDFMVEGDRYPLYIFGIGNKNKALRTNVILEHLLREKIEFENILVFREMATIPNNDLARLINVGGEMVASLNAQEDLSRKILRKVS